MLSRREAAQKEMDNYMIEMDRKLFEEDKQKRLEREDNFRREVQETLAQEDRLKRMREQVSQLFNLIVPVWTILSNPFSIISILNVQREAANAEADREREKQEREKVHLQIQEELEQEKKRKHETKVKMWHDLGQQKQLKNYEL